MTILLDTSVLVDHLRGNPAALQALRTAIADGEKLLCSEMTRVEILAGMRSREQAATRRLFEVLDWAPVDTDVAERAGALANRFLRSHPGVDPVDYVIAATAELSRAELWTLNLKHFPMFPTLTRPY